jgi:transcriptional regulator with XRE-family HTH domain
MSATQPLAILRELREAAGLSQADAARRVGLTGRQSRLTLGAWENGTYPADEKRRRTALIDYLWDVLRLRRDPVRFAEVWAVLEEAWGWEPLSDSEWRRLNQPPPAPITVAPPPFQAPASIAHFVGRAAELDELARRLQQPASRVALVGMGGAGKTSLAIEAAHRLRPHFPAGVLWASAATSDPLDILQSWAAAFGHDYSGLRDVASRAAAVRSLLAGKKVFLVLDDVRVAEQVAPLLPGDPANSIIMTTRSEDAAAAIHASIVPLAEWSQKESRELLVAVLGSGRVQQESEAAGELCSLVHHLPLAVEIAAQFLAVRTRQRLADMVRRLQGAQNRLDLRVSSRDVRTSFAVSWEALDEAHRQLFAALAVFEGRSFAVEAAAAVADLDEAITKERLENLKALSLVSEAEDERYRQHPLLADFAREQLGDEPGPWVRLARTYVEFLRRATTPLAISEEWGNTMGAMGAAYLQQEWSLVLEFAELLTRPWLAHARYTQARQGYTWANHATTALGDTVRRAACLQRWAQACLEQDEYEEAARLLAESLALCEQVKDEAGCATVHYLLARMALERAQYQVVEEHLNRSRTVRMRLGDEQGLAQIDYQEASLAYNLGQLAEAEFYCRRAFSTFEAAQNWEEMLTTLRLLADIAIERSDDDHAQQHCQRALRLAEMFQLQGELAATYYSLAVIARLRRQLSEALRYAQAAHRLFLELGERGFQALTLYEQSRICTLTHDLDTAEKLALQSLAILRNLDDKFNLVYILRHLASLYEQVDRPIEADCCRREALLLAEAQDHPLTTDLRRDSTNQVGV